MAITISGSGIVEANIADGAVSSDKLATGIDAIKLADGTITNSELQYINSLSSNAQTQISAAGVQTKVAQLGFNTATATSSVSITGVGFQPKSYACTACWGVADNNITHAIGDGTDNHMHLMKGDGTAGHWALSSDTYVAYCYASVSNRGVWAFTSFDADGMTMAWTRIGSPTGTFYMNILFHG
jgi:hypothetical protein